MILTEQNLNFIQIVAAFNKLRPWVLKEFLIAAEIAKIQMN